MSYAALEQTFNTLRDVDPRDAGEYAYALAMLGKQSGDTELAIRYGKEAVALFDKCQMETLDDCAAHRVSLGGVVIPEFIHQGVVRKHLQPLLV